eukprot:TRINITY_DN14937_c0_g1_i1.p1 TRINITY_DN14937_c0_g1~~TRINITY_DN14937_c0_g1_i1.p1  ORF type:complete len:317 (+),score=56.26 TRINITY_DN14937_c0_g1_i1:2-952(+)
MFSYVKFIIQWKSRNSKSFPLVEEGKYGGIQVVSFETVIESGKGDQDGKAREYKSPTGCSRQPDDLLNIVYTSGSSSTPTGVMWTDSIHNQVAMSKKLDIRPLIVLDFQPQEHAFSRRLVLRVICNGGQVGVHTYGDTLLTSIQTLRPTLFEATPSFWNTLYMEFNRQLHVASSSSNQSATVSSKDEQLMLYRKTLSLMRGNLLLGNRVRLIITGGAPTSESVKKFLMDVFLVPVSDVYATTETGTITVNGSITDKVDMIIRPVPDLDLMKNRNKLSGQICVKSETQFAGYYKNELLTKKSFLEVSSCAMFLVKPV